MKPQACHIFPFSAIKRRGLLSDALQSILGMFWTSARGARLQALITDNAHILDTAKNMICLTPTLHSWWANAYFALEPYEQLPNGVRIRLRWLKKTAFVPWQAMPEPRTDPRDYLNWPGEQEGILGIVDFESGHPLIDGSLFDLVSDDVDTQVSWDLIEIQWDLLRMAALSGAGEVADDPRWDSDKYFVELFESLHEEGMQGPADNAPSSSRGR